MSRTKICIIGQPHMPRSNIGSKLAKCVDCGIKTANFDLPLQPGEKRRVKWCSDCRHGRPGAVWTYSRSCEDCAAKPADSGLAAERGEKGALRWCRNCCGAHGGIYYVHGACADCNAKYASFGIPESTHSLSARVPAEGVEASGRGRGRGRAPRKVRWCRACADNHPGAIDVQTKRCEDCRDKQVRVGQSVEQKLNTCSWA